MTILPELVELRLELVDDDELDVVGVPDVEGAAVGLELPPADVEAPLLVAASVADWVLEADTPVAAATDVVEAPAAIPALSPPNASTLAATLASFSRYSRSLADFI